MGGCGEPSAQLARRTGRRRRRRSSGADTDGHPPWTGRVTTADEQRTFDDQGFLHVPHAIPPGLLDRLRAAVAGIYGDERRAGRLGAGAHPRSFWGLGDDVTPLREHLCAHGLLDPERPSHR